MRRRYSDERGDITVATMMLGALLIGFLFAMLVGGGFLRAAGDRSDRAARRAARAAAMSIDVEVYRATGEVVIDKAAALSIARQIASESGDTVEDLVVMRDRDGREVVVVSVSRPARLPVIGGLLPAEIVTVRRQGAARLEQVR